MKLNKKRQKKFWDKVELIPFHDCWEWIGWRNDSGYGQIWNGERFLRAHRVSYYLKFGKIPRNLFVLHRCDNRGCVNPDHLMVGTNQDNVDDMVSKGRNHHPPGKGGWRNDNLPVHIMEQLGKRADTDLAREIGATKYLIAKARRKLGIKAFPCQTRFKSGTPHPYWGRKGVQNASGN